jgi:hypothetical protein
MFHTEKFRVHKATKGKTLCGQKIKETKHHWMWTRITCPQCRALRMGTRKNPSKHERQDPLEITA